MNDASALEDKQIVAIFEEFDTSGDGFIDLGEFCHMVLNDVELAAKTEAEKQKNADLEKRMEAIEAAIPDAKK